MFYLHHCHERHMSILIVLWTVCVHEMCLVIRLIVIDVCLSKSIFSNIFHLSVFLFLAY